MGCEGAVVFHGVCWHACSRVFHQLMLQHKHTHVWSHSKHVSAGRWPRMQRNNASVSRSWSLTFRAGMLQHYLQYLHFWNGWIARVVANQNDNLKRLARTMCLSNISQICDWIYTVCMLASPLLLQLLFFIFLFFSCFTQSVQIIWCLHHHSKTFTGMFHVINKQTNFCYLK